MYHFLGYYYAGVIADKTINGASYLKTCNQFDFNVCPIVTNQYNDLEVAYNSQTFVLQFCNLKIPANTIKRETIIETIAIQNNDGSLKSYSQHYDEMRTSNSTFIKESNGELYTNRFQKLSNYFVSENNVLKEVRVKSIEQLKEDFSFDGKVVARYPNYAYGSDEKIESGELLNYFQRGDRLELLITIKNNTPMSGRGRLTALNGPFVWFTSTLGNDDNYNDILKDSTGYNGTTFTDFTLKPFKKYKQKVFVDVDDFISSSNTSVNNDSIIENQDLVGEKTSFSMQYITENKIVFNSGVYTKLPENSITDINNYKNLNLNYYTQDDKNIIYYAYILNETNPFGDKKIDLSEYDIYINYSDNQNFDGLCTILNNNDLPQIVENDAISVDNEHLFYVYMNENRVFRNVQETSFSVIEKNKNEVKVNTDMILDTGCSCYILFSLTKDENTTDNLETSVSICKKQDLVSKNLIRQEEFVIFPAIIENGEKLYTEDNLNHEITTSIANYEKMYRFNEELEFVTKPEHDRMLYWSGVYLKEYKPYKTTKAIDTSSALYGSGEKNNSVCFKIDLSNVVSESGDKNLVLYDELVINTKNFEEGKNITDYFEFEPVINNQDYLLLKNEDGLMTSSNVPRLVIDGEKISGISIKYYSGDLRKSGEKFNYELAEDDSIWEDNFKYVNYEDDKYSKVTMRIEIPRTFIQNATYMYKIFLKDSIKNIDGEISGSNKAFAKVTNDSFEYEMETGTVSFEYENKKTIKDLYDGTTRDVAITKKLGYYYSGDVVKEDFQSGEAIQFSIKDDGNNLVKFVDMQVLDDNGSHYKVAESGDTSTITTLSTYNGKIYVEGLYKYIPYKLIEETDFNDYETDEMTLSLLVTDGEGVYEHDVVNIAQFNYDVHIKKLDTLGSLISGDKAIFNITKDNKLIYFKYLGQENNENCYEMVGERSGDGLTSEIETYNGGINLRRVGLGEYEIKEIKAPEGYGYYGEAETLAVSNIFSPINKIIINEKLSGIQIVKYGRYKLDNDLYIDIGEITESKATFKLLRNDKVVPVVKLNIEDESGEHYRVAQAYDTETIEILETYNGRIYLEGLGDREDYYLREETAPQGYVKDFESKLINKNSNVMRLYNDAEVNNKVYIVKKDFENNLITSDTSKFEIYNESGEKLYFTKHDNQDESSLYELKGVALQEEYVSELETYNGKIRLINIPQGFKMTIKETKAPEGYVRDESDVNVTISDTTSQYQVVVKNGFAHADVNIVKRDTNGNYIRSNQIIYEIYNSNGEIIHFTDLKTDNTYGKNYEYSENGETRITTYNGKVYIKGLPIGEYSIKEIVAPDGYSLLDEEVDFVLTAGSYVEPKIVYVDDPTYQFGSEGYVSLSYQKIMERGNDKNYGYGFAKANDSNNYISVISKDDIVNYTLRVANNSQKAFKNIVLINKLADVDDTGTVNLNSKRESEYRISLTDVSNMEIQLFDEKGRAKTVNPELYEMEFTDETEYTEDDWNGEESEKWASEVGEGTQAFRITFDETFEIPSTYSIAVLFDGKISEEAKAGEIAWNSFGYRYYVDGVDLTAEPPKVGVMIAVPPTIRKEVAGSDAGDVEFVFEVYEKASNKLVGTITLKNGETKDIKLKRNDDGIIELGKTYVIKEREIEGYKVINTSINEGTEYYDSVEFEVDAKNAIEIVFTNEKEEEQKPKHNYGTSSRPRKVSENVEIIVEEEVEQITTNESGDKKAEDNKVEDTTKVTEEIVKPAIDTTDYVVYSHDEELPKTDDNVIVYVKLLTILGVVAMILKRKIR